MTRDELRAFAVARTLFPPTTLVAAVARLGFVQADPIRAPAPAQDLILRHRVRGYRVGDLERFYAERDVIEEDYLYAYGFVPRAIHEALHPRPAPAPSALEKRVLRHVRVNGRGRLADVASALGHARITNAWGGRSKATTHALERLHRHGLLRVASRDRGTRIYELARAHAPAPNEARLRTLVAHVAHVLGPVLERTLRANVTRFRHLGDPRAAIEALVARRALVRESVDGVAYLWPRAHARLSKPAPVVRFLAPFDPLVWDRRRFEHLWGWPYRFEAYTPAAKRLRGYYALPMLYGDDVIGWATVANGEVAVGFARPRPRTQAFETELEREIVRIQTI